MDSNDKVAGSANPKAGQKSGGKAAAEHPNMRLIEGLLDGKTPGRRQRKKKSALFRLRKMMFVAGFVAFVALPTAVASYYMTFVAVDQYESAASFSIREIGSASGGADILGMFSQAGGNNTGSGNSYILLDYILSERMVRELDARFDLGKIYAVRGGDFYYGMPEGLPIEKKVDFWRSVARVDYDQASSIITLKIRAFEPELARQVSEFVLGNCEKLINDLSVTARDEVLKAARDEIGISEKRFSDARNAMRAFREQSQDVDPIERAKLAVGLVAELEGQLTELNGELAIARSQMGEDTPRIRVLKTQVATVTAQIEQERQRLGSGASGPVAQSDQPAELRPNQPVAGNLQIYEELETEREFSEKAYMVSMAALEKARMNAAAKQRYLATFIRPTLSEVAQYPERLRSVFIVFLGGIFVWGMLTLGYYNLRDRT